MSVVGVSRALSNSPQGWLLPCCAGSCCSTRSHAADKKKAPQTSWRASFLCRWWGSNPHVLLAQGILSFYPHLPSGVIQWYLVISGSHCAKVKFTTQRIIIWNVRDFSMRFSSTLFFRFGPPKWKLEGCSGGMQGKTLLCLGTKRKESQGWWIKIKQKRIIKNYLWTILMCCLSKKQQLYSVSKARLPSSEESINIEFAAWKSDDLSWFRKNISSTIFWIAKLYSHYIT